ncbi:MAG: M23 family metallopeptidase [Mediterranea massiliensis]|nr:M23 family metallopeptidase [Mediterranea massiliensis]
MAKKRSKAFWSNIKFKYKLTIINENTLEELVGLHVSKLNGLSVLLSVLLVLFLIASLIIAYTPLRNYLPGYMNSEVRAQIVENALRADTLSELLQKQQLYILNIQDIFEGNIKTDTIHSIDSLTILREDTLIERSQHETEWRKQYEEREKYNLNDIETRSAIEGLMFYTPLRGSIVASMNNEDKHFGTDIASKAGESILATLEGTVIMSTYTAESGYTIALQHNQELISIYKQCGRLLKQIGDKVKAGEAIAIVGKAEDVNNSPHLHFELWRKGKAINPENYIVF